MFDLPSMREIVLFIHIVVMLALSGTLLLLYKHIKNKRSNNNETH